MKMGATALMEQTNGVDAQFGTPHNMCPKIQYNNCTGYLSTTVIPFIQVCASVILLRLRYVLLSSFAGATCECGVKLPLLWRICLKLIIVLGDVSSL